MEAVIVIVAAIAGIGIGVGGGLVLRNMMLSRGVDAAKDTAGRLLQQAEAEQKRLVLDAKEEAMRTKETAENEVRDRRRGGQALFDRRKIAKRDRMGKEKGLLVLAGRGVGEAGGQCPGQQRHDEGSTKHLRSQDPVPSFNPMRHAH